MCWQSRTSFERRLSICRVWYSPIACHSLHSSSSEPALCSALGATHCNHPLQNQPCVLLWVLWSAGLRFKVLKAVYAERGQLSRLWASSEVWTPKPQVVRVDNWLSVAGAPPPAQVSEAGICLNSLLPLHMADSESAWRPWMLPAGLIVSRHLSAPAKIVLHCQWTTTDRRLELSSQWLGQLEIPLLQYTVDKFKFDLQPGSLTVQVASEHQPYRKHP